MSRVAIAVPVPRTSREVEIVYSRGNGFGVDLQ